MLTTLKTPAAKKWTWSGRRFVRESPGEKQTDAPTFTLSFLRARYYDAQTGEFISRDPLGYVDGMSLYRGYFVPGGMDPSGLQDFVYVGSGAHDPAPKGYYKLRDGALFSNLKFSCACSEEDQAAIEAAWSSAIDAAGSAIEWTDNPALGRGARNEEEYLEGQRILRRFRTFFDAANDDGIISDKSDSWGQSFQWGRDVRGTIRTVFSKTQNGMKNKSVNIYCGGDHCDSSTAYKYRTGSLVFCPTYFSNKASIQAGIAFHEASHKWAGTNDWGYASENQTGVAGMAEKLENKLFGVHYWQRYRLEQSVFGGLFGNNPGYLERDYLMDNASTYQSFLQTYFLK